MAPDGDDAKVVVIAMMVVSVLVLVLMILGVLGEHTGEACHCK